MICVFWGKFRNPEEKPEDSLDFFKSQGMSLASINIVIQIHYLRGIRHYLSLESNMIMYSSS